MMLSLLMMMMMILEMMLPLMKILDDTMLMIYEKGENKNERVFIFSIYCNGGTIAIYIHKTCTIKGNSIMGNPGIWPDCVQSRIPGFPGFPDCMQSRIMSCNTPPQTQGGDVEAIWSLETKSRKRPGGWALVKMSAI